MEKANEKHHLGTVCHIQCYEVDGVMMFWMCMSYLRIYLYTHMMTQESFCKELEQVFDKFPKHHFKILLWQFSPTLQRPYNCRRWDDCRRWEHCAISRCRQMNVKWQSITCHKLIPQDTFTLTIGNECVQENRNDNGCYIQKSNCQEHSVTLFKPWSMHLNLY